MLNCGYLCIYLIWRTCAPCEYSTSAIYHNTLTLTKPIHANFFYTIAILFSDYVCANLNAQIHNQILLHLPISRSFNETGFQSIGLFNILHQEIHYVVRRIRSNNQKRTVTIVHLATYTQYFIGVVYVLPKEQNVWFVQYTFYSFGVSHKIRVQQPLFPLEACRHLYGGFALATFFNSNYSVVAYFANSFSDNSPNFLITVGTYCRNLSDTLKIVFTNFFAHLLHKLHGFAFSGFDTLFKTLWIRHTG